jgi:hypothetical protein
MRSGHRRGDIEQADEGSRYQGSSLRCTLACKGEGVFDAPRSMMSALPQHLAVAHATSCKASDFIPYIAWLVSLPTVVFIGLFSLMEIPAPWVPRALTVLGVIIAAYWLWADGLTRVGMVGFGAGCFMAGVGLFVNGTVVYGLILAVAGVAVGFVFGLAEVSSHNVCLG